MTATAKSSREAAARAWQRMLSGRRLDLLDPSPLDVEIEDIAHGLARVARRDGQTEGAHIFLVAAPAAAPGTARPRPHIFFRSRSTRCWSTPSRGRAGRASTATRGLPFSSTPPRHT